MARVSSIKTPTTSQKRLSRRRNPIGDHRAISYAVSFTTSVGSPAPAEPSLSKSTTNSSCLPPNATTILLRLRSKLTNWASHGSIQKSKGVLGRRTTNTSLQAEALTFDNEAGKIIRCVVLDIEGATTPISYVTDVLFPYARDNVRMHLEETYDTADTKDDIKLSRSQVEDDLHNGVVGAAPIPSDDAGKEAVIAALVANVEEIIKADRKIISLKQLQVGKPKPKVGC